MANIFFLIDIRVFNFWLLYVIVHDRYLFT